MTLSKKKQPRDSSERRGAMRSEFRVARDIAQAALDPSRPLIAHLVITDKCNLSCGYCFEYDKRAKPVPLSTLKERIDELKRLKVVFVTLNGGEPLTHPDVVALVAYIAEQGLTPLMNSNGLLLTVPRIKELNDAGLFGIQISCDGMLKNECTSKTMDRLRPIFDLLAQRAQFRVRVNSVLGAGPPEEALEVARICMDYGFDTQCSLVRDAKGGALPLDAASRSAYREIRALGHRLPLLLNDDFQVALSEGKRLNWKCRSGARYFHVDAGGLVHLCQPRLGEPAIPLSEYGPEQIELYFNMHKTCSKRCAHAYAHIGSRMDVFRPQDGAALGEQR